MNGILEKMAIPVYFTLIIDSKTYKFTLLILP